MNKCFLCVFVAIFWPLALHAQNAGQSVSADVYAVANRSASTPVVTTSPVPDLLETNYRYNTSPFEQSNLATAYDQRANHWWQYFVYFDEARQAHITRRNFTSHGSWQTPVNIHAAIGGDRLEDDSHNTIAVGIDSEGYIHVTGNHHVDPLNYAISNQPHNLSGFTNRPSMIPSDERNSERRVTYPTFFNTVDGELMFFYRNQLVSPSRFASYLNRWNPATRQWRRVVKLAEGPDLRFYHQRIAVDNTGGPNNGRIHIMAMWRNDAGSGSGTDNNEDLFHLYSDDNGESWNQFGSGSVANLPLSLGRVDDLILNTRPHPNSVRFSNQSGMELDASGRPHALVSMNDNPGSGNRHYFHIWHNGQSWQVNRLNTFRPGSRSAIVTTRSGEVYGMFTRSISGDSRFVLLNLTPGSSRYDDEVITLSVGLTDDGSAPNYDAGALYHHNRLSFLATRGPISPAASNINYLQGATVVTLDLAQLNSLRISPFLAPANLRFFSDHNSVNALVSGGSPSRVYATNGAIPQDSFDRPLSAKITVNARMQGSGTGSVSIRHQSRSGTRQSGRLTFSGSSSRTASTPVLPLFDYRSGVVEIVGSVSNGGGSLAVNSVSIEIFRVNSPPFPQDGSSPVSTNTPAQVSPTQITPAPVPSVQVQTPGPTQQPDPDSSTAAQSLECIDTDGDGYGWDGTASCLVSSTQPATSTSVLCVDSDGDGWGWNGQSSCLVD